MSAPVTETHPAIASDTHITNVDGVTPVSARGGVVSKRIGRHRRSSVVATPISTPAIAAAPTEAAEATAASKTTATAKTATTAVAIAAAAVSESCTGVAILANFEVSPLPFIAIELLDSITSIISRFKYNNTGTFRAAARVGVDICADHSAVLGCTVQWLILVCLHPVCTIRSTSARSGLTSLAE